MGTRKIEIPRFPVESGSVRASTKQKCAQEAYDVQIFVPVRTYSSPSRTALSVSAARSVPACGSEKPWHQITSPAVIRRRW